MMGALPHYITHADPDDFQPMKANMGLLPELSDPVRSKRQRYAAYAARAHMDLTNYLAQADFVSLPPLETQMTAESKGAAS